MMIKLTLIAIILVGETFASEPRRGRGNLFNQFSDWMVIDLRFKAISAENGIVFAW